MRSGRRLAGFFKTGVRGFLRLRLRGIADSGKAATSHTSQRGEKPRSDNAVSREESHICLHIFLLSHCSGGHLSEVCQNPKLVPRDFPGVEATGRPDKKSHHTPRWAGQVHNNHIENQIWPIAMKCSNWPFAGPLQAGNQAAAKMSLIQWAKLNGHDPYAYLSAVVKR